MADKCSVCQKNGATVTCHECEVLLCDECAKEVRIESMSPTQRVGGQLTSPLKPGVKKFKVCPKCMQEAEFLG